MRLHHVQQSPVSCSGRSAFRHTLHEIHERIKMFVQVKNKH
ncbi:ArsR family transcriptional regulator [Pseudomonas frederiksbergensis]|nr:ArsR family transcriptional regulator [Pseudomonas frederiksbergensis]